MDEASVANIDANMTRLPKRVEKHQIAFLYSREIDRLCGAVLLYRCPRYEHAKLVVAVEHQTAAVEALRISPTPSIRRTHAGAGCFDDGRPVIVMSRVPRGLTNVLHGDVRTRSAAAEQQQY